MRESRFERWQAEKIKRQKAGLPPIVEYRHETYVSAGIIIDGLIEVDALGPAEPDGQKLAQW